MEKPDLHALAARAEAIKGALGDLARTVDEAEDAAFGTWDEKREEIVEGTGSGDEPVYFDKARTEVNEALGAVNRVQEIVATVQGHRDFAESYVDG